MFGDYQQTLKGVKIKILKNAGIAAGILLVVFLWLLSLLIIFLVSYLNLPSVEGKLKLSNGVCATVLNSLSDSKNDVPPYGNMVFLDKCGCCAAGVFRKYCATQIFGAYCHEIKLSETSKGTLSILCKHRANEPAEPALELKQTLGISIKSSFQEIPR